jgi:two-component system phosphate regulon sensor histidine kinase PhoR
MKKKQLITGIIILMSVSLLCILVLQYIHIRNSYNKSKELIERSVSEAIGQTIFKLRKHEALRYAYDNMNKKDPVGNLNKIPIDPRLLQLGIDSFRQTMIGLNNTPSSYYGISSFKTNDLEKIEEFVHQLLNERQLRFEQLMMQIESEFMQNEIPIENRFDVATISNILKKSLLSHDLDLDFEFAITDDNYNIKLQSENFDMSRKKELYKYNMAPENIFSNPNLFLVDFPTKNKYAMESIHVQLITSTLFILLFIITFGISIYALVRQKKLSKVKNDFINNMTHEFKTPIATIKLATASLRNMNNSDNPKGISGMLDIITQETSRINHHIEQVLQMAVLDKKNLEILKRKEDINEIIHNVISNTELVVAEKGGSITFVSIDDNVFLNVDRDLLTNVFNNMIDNAIKYSKDAPEIKITSFIERDKFHISFRDNGLGMSKEIQEKIFDRFYRAPTGNVHNIKGFGLGLNYAKEIVSAHKGDINVRSCPGKGSIFTVILPLK